MVSLVLVEIHMYELKYMQLSLASITFRWKAWILLRPNSERLITPAQGSRFVHAYRPLGKHFVGAHHVQLVKYTFSKDHAACFER